MDRLRLAAENYKLWRDECLKKLDPRPLDAARLRVLQENLAQIAVDALT